VKGKCEGRISHVESDPQFVDDWDRLPLFVKVLRLGNILFLVGPFHLVQTPQSLARQKVTSSSCHFRGNHHLLPPWCRDDMCEMPIISYHIRCHTPSVAMAACGTPGSVFLLGKEMDEIAFHIISDVTRRVSPWLPAGLPGPYFCWAKKWMR
jgi:hypothetical protein